MPSSLEGSVGYPTTLRKEQMQPRAGLGHSSPLSFRAGLSVPQILSTGKDGAHTLLYRPLCGGQAQRGPVTCPRSQRRAQSFSISLSKPLGVPRREPCVCTPWPRLTVGLMGSSWLRLEVLLRGPSHRLGEAGVATQLGSWARGPEGGFILRWGSPFSSCQGISCAQPPNLPPTSAPLPGLRLPVPASCVEPAWSYSRS